LNIEKVYSDFVSKVAAGRNMTVTAVDSIGQGRVWTGILATRIGLVDETGGLKDAIKGAAKLAGLESYSIRELPEIEDPYTRILNQLSGDLKLKLLRKELGESSRIINELAEIRDLSGIQARLPYFFDLRAYHSYKELPFQYKCPPVP
jgi:protease-4